MARQYLTIQAIRLKYPRKQKQFEWGNLWGYFVLRNISFYLAWLLLKLGVSSANKVSWTSLVIGGIGCVLLAFGSYGIRITGAVLINVWALLDYVDGHIARYHNSANNYGRFTDGLCDYIMSILLFTSAGIGAFTHPDPYLNSVARSLLGVDIDKSLFLFLGVWASLFYIFPRFVGDEFLKIYSQGQSNAVFRSRQDVLTGITGKLDRVGLNLSSLTGIVMPVLLLATIFKFLSIFVFLWAVINSFVFIALLIPILRKAKSSNG